MTKSLILLAAVSALSLVACDNKNESANSGVPASLTSDPIPAPNGGDWRTIVTQTAEGGFLMGNPDAPVKLVEFGSLTCPHCREFDEKALGPITDTYVKSGRVSFEFRNYLLGGPDLAASLIARCAGPAGFFGLMRQLYADQPNWVGKAAAIDPAEAQALQAMPPSQQLPRLAEIMGLQQFASLRGVPVAKSNACLADQAEIDKLVAMQGEANSTYEIPGTPSFLINGELLKIDAGVEPWVAVERGLKEALGG